MNHAFKNQCFTQKWGIQTACTDLFSDNYRLVLAFLAHVDKHILKFKCANEFCHFSMQYTLWTNCYHLDTVCSSLDNELLRIPGMLKFCL